MKWVVTASSFLTQYDDVMKKKGLQLIGSGISFRSKAVSLLPAQGTPARSTRSILVRSGPGSRHFRNDHRYDLLSSVSSDRCSWRVRQDVLHAAVGHHCWGAHHSTLEVATPLSQNGLIDYAVGQYTSLYPKHRSNPAAGGLKSALEAAEKAQTEPPSCVG